MEEILSRFPHIGENIFNELNSKDFCMSKEVNRSWNYFIKNQRILKKACKKRVQEKINNLTIEDPRNGVWMKTTAFHLAAKKGYLPVCQQIMENSDDKNPKDRFGWTPLHKAAQKGHLSVCQLIVRNVDDKNPKNYNGCTPLHWAAENGHLSVCQIIVENVDDKNPKDKYGRTQLATNADIKNLVQDTITK